MARHCLYLPEGSPVVTGEVLPTDVHDRVVSVLRKTVSDALTSRVMLVPTGNVPSQASSAHSDPVMVVSRTWEAMVPEDAYCW